MTFPSVKLISLEGQGKRDVHRPPSEACDVSCIFQDLKASEKAWFISNSHSFQSDVNNVLKLQYGHIPVSSRFPVWIPPWIPSSTISLIHVLKTATLPALKEYHFSTQVGDSIKTCSGVTSCWGGGSSRLYSVISFSYVKRKSKSILWNVDTRKHPKCGDVGISRGVRGAKGHWKHPTCNTAAEIMIWAVCCLTNNDDPGWVILQIMVWLVKERRRTDESVYSLLMFLSSLMCLIEQS